MTHLANCSSIKGHQVTIGNARILSLCIKNGNNTNGISGCGKGLLYNVVKFRCNEKNSRGAFGIGSRV